MRSTSLVLLLTIHGCADYSFFGKPDHVRPNEDTGDADGETEGEPDPSDSDEPEDTDGTDEPDDPDGTDVDVPPPEEFSIGWHILDDDVAYETTSSPGHTIDHHGDEDLYWYEPSGVHGLTDSTDPVADFAQMRDYVIERVPEPRQGIGLLHYYADSEITTWEFATFTYILCDFWVDEGEDPSIYELVTGPVDDGIQVMVNGEILGRLKLDDPGGSWNLGSVLHTDARNTLIVLLVDDSAMNKFVQDLAFYRDGAMVTAEPLP